MNKLDRAQEWLADRVSFIQYPRLRPADARTASHHGIRWKNKMPWEFRLGLLLWSVLTLALCAFLLCALLFGVYILVTS